MNTTHVLSALSLIVGTAVPTIARAQDMPEGLMTQDAASSGTTDVTTEGFAAPSAPPDEESKDATDAALSAGSLIAAGNSKSFAATGAGTFRLRRNDHQLNIAASANYGRSAPDRDSPMETTVENVQGRVRYDYFVADHLALFTAVSARRDRFQGLDLRLNIDPGIAYYFIDGAKRQLWTELGYDLQFDMRDDEALAQSAADGVQLDDTEVRHHSRLFLGYDDTINPMLTFSTGVEYLQGLADRINWRLNWDAALKTSIAESFSLATTISIKYDNNPIPGVGRADAVTALNLVYQLL